MKCRIVTKNTTEPLSQGKTQSDVSSGKGREGQLIIAMLAAFLQAEGRTLCGVILSPLKVGWTLIYTCNSTSH